MRATRNPGFASIQSPQAQRAGPRRSSYPNHPVRASRSPNSDLRSPIPWFSTFVVPPSDGFPSSVAQDKNHETHETGRPHPFLCSLCFLLFILFFVFALASIDSQFRRRTGAHEAHRTRTPSPACPCFIRGGVLNGPTRLRFELVRAGACPIQARSASKWIKCFGPCRTLRRSRIWSAETCYRFLAYSRPQTPSSRVPDLPTPICDLRHLVSVRHPPRNPSILGRRSVD